MLESSLSILFAIAIAVYFSWPLAIITCLLMPFFLIGSFLGKKGRTAVWKPDLGGSDFKKEADLLAADAIANYKTV